MLIREKKRIKMLFDPGFIECRAISVNLYWTKANKFLRYGSAFYSANVK